MKTVNQIRSTFLNFFERNGHEIVASSSLVPQNDPTLMFTNAGMNQFKDVFTGKETRPYKRATTAQKCVRAGGKHNDLENVGYTARHHTFFEMLGNFSFGDYFKEEAIAFAWELVTKDFELPPEKLCVTVHSSDEEAAAIWKKVSGFADEKIIRIPTDDNFWRMGDTGPCGPCTEIFYDHGEHIWGGPPGSPEEDGDRFIEIWNNVFMQYEQIDADTKINLPAQSVDTGMGLERIAATLMGSNSNYDIDIFQAIMQNSADLTGVDYKGDQAPSHKVIADHLRAASFLMADGVMPSNEGRGYVLRRIMRRGMRHAHLLGAQDPLMYKLFPTLRDKMGEAYPELERAESLIVATLEMEEKRFKTTLDRGLKILDEEKVKVASGSKFPGDIAFKLYDTFGFPLDLTQDALRADNIEVDIAGFDALMELQKIRARKSWVGSGDLANEKIWFDILEDVEPTEFLGYEVEGAEGKILAVVVNDVRMKNGAQEGDIVSVILNQTPFYAESGGQVGDTGIIITESAKIKITDTKKVLGKLWVHQGIVEEGIVTLGQTAKMEVDHSRRTAIRANHSVTHLMHEALRRVLGDHVTQKGSLQDDQRTRFDISHPKGMSAEELAEVEAMVNEEIKADTDVTTRVMGLDEAREIGAMALFGEKYADEVRVVAMGTQKEGENKPFSIELCGGTHVKKTGEIEKFKIVSDSALSAGIRRLEAVTGSRVDAYEESQAKAQQDVFDTLIAKNKALREELSKFGGSIDDVVPNDPAELEKQNKKLDKEIADLRRQKAAKVVEEDNDRTFTKDRSIGKFVNVPVKELKSLADQMRAQHSEYDTFVLGTVEGDKASFVVSAPTGANEWANQASVDFLGGRGGGRPDMAQGGGPNTDKLEEAIQWIVTTSAAGT
ncbi:MAG: alanine--tRNA ligase [Alphaproteobacteria bacterium]|nr:alanine--tRNA ligase [Alphaproteobacteria bacterium]